MGRVPMGKPPGGSWNLTQGPLTRDARDAALILQAIAGPDGAEVISLQDDAPDYLDGIDAGMEGLRLAWTDDFGFTRKYAGPETERVLQTAREAAFGFANLGAQVDVTDETFPEWVGMLSLGVTGRDPAPGPDYVHAQDLRRQWWDGFRRIFADHDLLVTTTIQHVAFTVDRWNQSWTEGLAEFSPLWCAHTFPHNFLGWPALSVPCGFVDGMPVSVQITGRPDTEGLIFRAAQALLRSNHFFDIHPEVAA